MITKTSTPTAETNRNVAANDEVVQLQSKLFESGIYYKSGSECIKIDPTKTNESKVSGQLGAALTGGLSPMKIKTIVSGKEADRKSVV